MSELPTLSSTLLSGLPGVRHAFFTRQGGASAGLYDSLNMGKGSKDDPAAVDENRRRVAAWFGAEPDALLGPYQIHSTLVHVTDRPWSGDRPEGDGVATAVPGLVCSALAADCAPVLLADPQARVVAACHAGWKGALGGVVESAVRRMEELGAARERVVAAVGPCIGPDSYEVGLEFLDRFAADAPGSERFFAAGDRPDKRRFDLPGFVLDQLRLAGVPRAEWIGRDTCTEEALFFSNRRAFRRGELDYGRLVSCIMLT